MASSSPQERRLIRPLKNLAEVAVIGGGLAGLAAARHAARLGRLVTLFEGSGLYGGQVATVGHVEGMPSGAPSGQDLAIPMLEDARKVGVQVIEANVASLDAAERLTLTDESGSDYHPDVVIVAAGGALRKLVVPGEDTFAGRGVSSCATCDGGFYRGKDVVVVGGGDAAVHEALTLAPLVRRVTLVSRSPLKAKREYVDRLDARDNVEFVWHREVAEIRGERGVEAVRLRDVRTGETSELACAAVFPFIGVVPNTAFLPSAWLSAGGRLTGSSQGRQEGPVSLYATAHPGVFAAGAVREGFGGTAIEALAEGVGAAAAAARLLAVEQSARLLRHPARHHAPAS